MWQWGPPIVWSFFLLYIKRLTFSYEVVWIQTLYQSCRARHDLQLCFYKRGHPHFHYHSNGNTTIYRIRKAKDMPGSATTQSLSWLLIADKTKQLTEQKLQSIKRTPTEHIRTDNFTLASPSSSSPSPSLFNKF